MNFIESLYRYNVPWYRTPLHIQKLILFLLQRGSKAFTWNIGGIFTLSLECFASVNTIQLYYYTIILFIITIQYYIIILILFKHINNIT